MNQKLLRALSRSDADEIKGFSSSNLLTGRTVQGNTALHIAARLGNKNVVQQIPSAQSLLLYEKNVKGKTPIHIAAAAGDVTVVKLFIDNQSRVGVNILRMRDHDDNIPLHNATRSGHLQVVEKLTVEDPATINFVNKARQTPLAIAFDGSFTCIIKWIISKDSESLNYTGFHNLTLLHSAVIRPDYSEKMIFKIDLLMFIYSSISFSYTSLYYI
ncbi:hypothetical protein Ddye_027282 [Dipteronia dyeriana]|uniref:Uncharacterized protein n=1 Tax=Dipteronia dyeriana TaxID=168575 RepID=A0AAD9TNS9_9ROSI|nr:hypothetical protein Ddye_027282 [Dipteronia dyeriana]